MHERPVCTAEARIYSGVDEFLSLFHPLTPGGKDWLDAFPVCASLSEIGTRLDDTEAVIAFMRRTGDDRARMDRIRWHLGRATRLPDLTARLSEGTGGKTDVGKNGMPGSDGLGLAEIFSVKKFIANYRAVASLVDEKTACHFRLKFDSENLLSALSEGGSDPETFFIADSHAPDLCAVRREIRGTDEKLRDMRRDIANEVRAVYGLDFSHDEYLIVPHGFLRDPGEGLGTFTLASYDNTHWHVSLRATPSELRLETERERLASLEVECEDRVLARLSSAAFAESGRLSEYEIALVRFDLARAGAESALVYGLVRPRISVAEAQAGALAEAGADSLYSLRGGRFLPCARTCVNVGSEYTPLDLELRDRAAVIFGSNMGGKTVALRSVLFFQILAQMGLFVPASSFTTCVMPFIHYIGDAVHPGDPRIGSLSGGAIRQSEEGLSGFGFEIRNFCEAWRDSENGALLAFDEFARTTSSPEAEALISAMLAALVKRPGMICLFATHFSGVVRLPGVRYLRVTGLDRLAATFALASDLPLADRIRQINGLMRHGLVDDAGKTPDGSDAVAIAALLGLDASIARSAGEFFASGRARDDVGVALEMSQTEKEGT